MFNLSYQVLAAGIELVAVTSFDAENAAKSYLRKII